MFPSSSLLSPQVLLPFFLFLSAQGPLALAKGDNSTVELVQVLYRHGDRGPIFMYPTDPHKDVISTVWPTGLGQLTKKGKAMQYDLGRWLRKRYGNLVSPSYVPQEVTVLSTDVDRTLMSAACNLASFYYPREEDERFEANLTWVPTPIHTVPAKYDKLLNVDMSCPRIHIEEKRLEELPEVKKVIEENQDLFKFVSEKAGTTVDNITTMSYLFDTLYIESLYNLTLPEWTTDIYDRMKILNNFSFRLMAWSHELKRLRAGPLIKEFQDNMRKSSIGASPANKMYMYSGHDKTVATLLEGLGVFNGLAPPYIATVLVELHRIDDNHFVKMFYRNDTSMREDPHPLTLHGCPTLCPLDKWVALTTPVVPRDRDKECHSSSPFDLPPLNAIAGALTGTYASEGSTRPAHPTRNTATSAAMVLGLLLLLLVIYNVIAWRRQKYQISYQPVPSTFP